MRRLLSLLCFALIGAGNAAFALPTLTPPALHPGDTVALISSAFRVDNYATYLLAKRRLEKLGLHVVTGRAVLGHDGYFAGTDLQRVEDINGAFADPNIKAIFEIRGGWGSARLLNQLNYREIREHPKIIIGFSDITSLLLAIHDQTGLVTFYGPMPGVYGWPDFTTQQLRTILFGSQAPIVMHNAPGHPITVITPGVATGQLIGGNLTVLTSLVGTPALPENWHGKILFVEDTHEDVYQIDRMLTQLQLAGILNQISGFVFGTCTGCTAEIPGSPSMIDIIRQHIAPLHIPAWYGAMIGHQSALWTVPEGVDARIDANQGTITLLQAPVH